jgi:hypothetical protein
MMYFIKKLREYDIDVPDSILPSLAEPLKPSGKSPSDDNYIPSEVELDIELPKKFDINKITEVATTKAKSMLGGKKDENLTLDELQKRYLELNAEYADPLTSRERKLELHTALVDLHAKIRKESNFTG